MNTLKDRIALASAGMPRGWKASLAVRCGVSKPSVSDWASGSTVSIDANNLFDAANFFGVNPNWLATGEGPMRPESGNVSNAAPARGAVPVISSVRAGNWGEINDHIPGGIEMFSVREAKVGPRAFALRVEGDSMTWEGLPNFPEGTMLIVDPDRSAKAGDYVIAKNTDKQAALFKKLVTDGHAWQLKSLNRDFKPIDIDDPAVRVVGVVVEYWAGGKL